MKKLAITVALLVIGALFWLRQFDSQTTQDIHRVDAAALREPPAGALIGYRDNNDTQAWLGIPYAQAPVGPLRWRAPLPLTAWRDTRSALSMGSPCTQFWGPISGLAGSDGDIVGAEDCLYLNIWAPASNTLKPEARWPVMVWIHGGGNSIGTGNTYNGSHLAGRQKVVVVTLNYRLGVLGWFSHPALRAAAANAADASGNYGTLDMLEALRWVQKNIAAFGGDPTHVTVFGESAGGHDVFALLGSPLAKNLFQRAIVQSGSLRTSTVDWAENYRDTASRGADDSSREILLGLLQTTSTAATRTEKKRQLEQMTAQQTEDYLRAQTPARLLTHFRHKLQGYGMYTTPDNIRDGYVLPKESLLTVFNSPATYNAVPILMGSNRDENKSFMAQDPHWVKKILGVLPRIRDTDRYNRFAAYYSDQWKALAVDEPAVVLSRADNSHVYTYRFDWDEAPANALVDLSALVGAGHGLEVAFVFGDFAGGIAMPQLLNEQNAAGRMVLSAQMMSYWAEFAYTGSPGRGREENLPEWRAWRPDQPQLMVLNTEAGGGVRLTADTITAQMLKERLAADKFLLDQKERCALYVKLFIDTFQTDDFWREQEYQTLNPGGCGRYPLTTLLDEK